LPEDPRAELAARLGKYTKPLDRRPGLQAYWGPRLQRIIDWVAAQEPLRRARAERVHAERRGKLELKEAGDFLLHGKADRIEELADGSLAVLDYKTGTAPGKTDVLTGKSPQLALEAIIAEAGGFEKLGGKSVEELVYWRLSGGSIEGEETTIALEPGFVEETRKRFAAFVRAYSDPKAPFLARPRPDFELRYNDYAHLARLKEWAADGGES
jgi:ATP-dependent helicase/nuclease subunit B